MQVSSGRVNAHWGSFNDPQSGITSYEWGVGTAPGLDDLVSFANVGQRTAASAGGLSMYVGLKVFVTVEACNHAHLCVQLSSDGVIIDSSPPVVVSGDCP